MMAGPVNNRLRFSIVVLLLLLAEGCATITPRKDTLVKDGWSFARRDVPGAQNPRLDDSQWQKISLPHTYNALDGQDGGSNYYRGPAWYRTHLVIPSDDAQKQIFLRFEAASLAARVYVNGQFAGEHRGGFAAFCFNITTLVHKGDNLIAVRVDNSFSPDIPPLSGDFTICGGLYRNVHLLVLNPLSISPTDDASPGVYLAPIHVDAASAQVLLTTVLRNDLDTPEQVTAACTIADAKGNVLATQQVAQSLSAHSTGQASTSIVIHQPHLWNGRADPYLYHATVRLLHNGRAVDQVTQPLGLRYFNVDPRTGFFLNGQSYPLHGVGIHQDYYNKGWAIDPADIDTNYKLVNELGCTAVRLAHYQHPEYEYSVCDRSGLVVWAEIPLVNRITDTPAFYACAQQQLRELIKQNFNHPSICFWSLFNELGPHTRTDWKLVDELDDLAHKLDPSRLTTSASHLPARYAVNWIPDLHTFNRYYGWYTDTVNVWPAQLDKLHAAYPDRTIGISEYGAGASIFQHQIHPTTQPVVAGPWHPEEWQAIVHETAYTAMKQRPWLWGTFIWCMFDFACDERNEGDHPGRNDKGLVTIDRDVKKDAFYFYKANWSTDPFVYITSRRFNPHPPGSVQFKIYSNCNIIHLTVNHQPLSLHSLIDHVFVSAPFELNPGLCELQATGSKDGRVVTDIVTWNVAAEATK
jgi:beta-galactosidase